MRCPRCVATLALQPAGRKGVLHACPEGHGAFGTDADLAHVLPVAAHATLRDAMARATPADLACPACGVAMGRCFAHRGGDRVELDSCPACQGTWFDAGELERVKRPADAPLGAASSPGPHARALSGGGSGQAWASGGDGLWGVVEIVAGLLDGI